MSSSPYILNEKLQRFREELVLCFNVFCSKIVYFIWFVIERSFSFIVVWNIGRLSWVFSAAFKMLFHKNRNRPLIETLYLLFFNYKLVIKSYEPKNLLDTHGKTYKILSEIWNVQFFSTRCMNMMFVFNWYIFNWYIFNIFCSLRTSLVCATLFL